jgi:low affinity Fe/Cu permease
MIFLIQLQAKLDELMGASSARNVFVGLKQMSTEEIAEIRQEVPGISNDAGRPRADSAAY